MRLSKRNFLMSERVTAIDAVKRITALIAEPKKLPPPDPEKSE
jgi:hypothetical protein